MLEANVKTFSIIGDKILFLDYDNKLSCASIKGSVSWTQEKIEKFYYNGEIYAQNNNSVVAFNLYKHKPKEIVSGIDELIGVDDENIYFISEKVLYSFALKDGKKTKLNYEYDYYKGIYKIKGKIIAIGGVKDEN